MCFKAKDLIPAVKGATTALVCKGCWYDVDRIVGYLEFYGLTMTAVPAITPPTPPTTTRRRSKAQDGVVGPPHDPEDPPGQGQGALPF